MECWKIVSLKKHARGPVNRPYDSAGCPFPFSRFLSSVAAMAPKARCEEGPIANKTVPCFARFTFDTRHTRPSNHSRERITEHDAENNLLLLRSGGGAWPDVRSVRPGTNRSKRSSLYAKRGYLVGTAEYVRMERWAASYLTYGTPAGKLAGILRFGRRRAGDQPSGHSLGQQHPNHHRVRNGACGDRRTPGGRLSRWGTALPRLRCS